jgi:RNA polymerase sigma factor (sigma-70 family)
MDNTDRSDGNVAHIDWAEVYQAMLTLKPQEQTVITLRFFEQMSHDQIAGVLNLQTASVRVVLSRALEKLRVRLGVGSGQTTAKAKD